MMISPSQPLSDRHLDAATTMSCKREPACFAFLCMSAVAAPVAIERFHFDIVSADYHRGRASVWATLEMLPDLPGAEPMALLGFDDGFLRPFVRAVLEAGATRVAHRMRIVATADDGQPPHAVDYVRSHGGTRITDLVVTPFDCVIAIAAANAASGNEEATLFQLPRTDTFLRALARTAHMAETAIKDTLRDMERLARARE